MNFKALGPALVALVLAAGCGDAETCSDRSVRFLSPSPGTVVEADEVTLVIEACGFERDEILEVRLLQPVETNYGFITVFDDPVVTIDVPTLPGTMEFRAQDQDGVTRSASLVVEVPSRR